MDDAGRGWGGSVQRSYLDMCRLWLKVWTRVNKALWVGTNAVLTGSLLPLGPVFWTAPSCSPNYPGRFDKIYCLPHEALSPGIRKAAQASTILSRCGCVGSLLQGRILR